MALTKVGTIVDWHASSSVLAVFRLMPEKGAKFPPYKAGQYIALRRNDCRLTRKVVRDDGTVDYPTILDEKGNPKRGAVTHSYSIASAPFETLAKDYLEFYVILEQDDKGVPGRLTESMFRMDPKGDNKLTYYDKIAGNFTLEDRAAGCANVVLVGTGTGLAPFCSMIKQLDHEAGQGSVDGVKYTLVHANRTYEELDYREELLRIQADKKFDFVYIPSVSRPTPRDLEDPTLGKARANNLLRHILEMPLKEEEDLREAQSKGADATKVRAALDKTVRPFLPAHLSRNGLRKRMNPPDTVVLTCGNPSLMADIQHIAEANGFKYEKEDW